MIKPEPDSRHSRGYLLQLTDSAWYLRGAKVPGEETAKKKKKNERRENKYDGVKVRKRDSEKCVIS